MRLEEWNQWQISNTSLENKPANHRLVAHIYAIENNNVQLSQRSSNSQKFSKWNCRFSELYFLQISSVDLTNLLLPVFLSLCFIFQQFNRKLFASKLSFFVNQSLHPKFVWFHCNNSKFTLSYLTRSSHLLNFAVSSNDAKISNLEENISIFGTITLERQILKLLI